MKNLSSSKCVVFPKVKIEMKMSIIADSWFMSIHFDNGWFKLNWASILDVLLEDLCTVFRENCSSIKSIIQASIKITSVQEIVLTTLLIYLNY